MIALVALVLVGLAAGFLVGMHLENASALQPYVIVLLLALLAYAVEVLKQGKRGEFLLSESLQRLLYGLVLAELVVWLGVHFGLDLYLAPAAAYVVLALLYLHAPVFAGKPSSGEKK